MMKRFDEAWVHAVEAKKSMADVNLEVLLRVCAFLLPKVRCVAFMRLRCGRLLGVFHKSYRRMAIPFAIQVCLTEAWLKGPVWMRIKVHRTIAMRYFM